MACGKQAAKASADDDSDSDGLGDGSTSEAANARAADGSDIDGSGDGPVPTSVPAPAHWFDVLNPAAPKLPEFFDSVKPWETMNAIQRARLDRLPAEDIWLLAEDRRTIPDSDKLFATGCSGSESIGH